MGVTCNRHVTCKVAKIKSEKFKTKDYSRDLSLGGGGGDKIKMGFLKLFFLNC
jgi:hypothetical protein